MGALGLDDNLKAQIDDLGSSPKEASNGNNARPFGLDDVANVDSTFEADLAVLQLTDGRWAFVDADHGYAIVDDSRDGLITAMSGSQRERLGITVTA
ncbi:MAG: hypothetical protein M3O70_08955 [Actinomycetota bacterium]|nr:hypothetical protein [Actinomycetota bacterium]